MPQRTCQVGHRVLAAAAGQQQRRVGTAEVSTNPAVVKAAAENKKEIAKTRKF